MMSKPTLTYPGILDDIQGERVPARFADDV